MNQLTLRPIVCFAMFLHCLSQVSLNAQTSSVIIPSNISTGSLEKNLLFYANKRYQVTRQGPNIALDVLFDGRFQPTESSTAPTSAQPLEILVENLPPQHTQQGAWIGWSSRNWIPTSFKIEGYNVYNGVNQWVTVANVTNHSQRHYMVKMPGGSFSKLRFSFYTASGTDGRMQLSQLFYIHPEAVQSYDGVMVKYDASGNVGIGTATPQAKLAVNGNILAKEVKVKTDITVPDYVFESGYELPALTDIEAYVKENKHLPEIPSAKDIEKDGLDLAEMNLLLLKKVEELTLHLIEKEKNERLQDERIERLERQLGNR
ncbi:hypothetical protein [Parapedobacter koreensis]|uniref:Uncharacterized protein n=1 Tax=Parapedobacter koreensis TaxID=332977 RepID=A0A1H7UF26_9SPHI|nr:hypothetical protein [Parapedobacter koreensis]SEL95258.1 hypothetical protein SAMN05421740_11518 [Parapedobacter koreensis]